MFSHVIYRREPLDITGPAIYRDAVRAVIRRGDEFFMVYSTTVGYYTFPGGGIKKGETHIEALTREVREEAGASVTAVSDLLGEITEYDRPKEPDYNVFRMISHYYQVSIENSIGSQHLDDYEIDLGFTPVWVNIDQAISTNSAVLQKPDLPMPAWPKRELLALQELKKELSR
jgi:8-oxo-dGTP pyrophosphatase MutT (NUDIX family)